MMKKTLSALLALVLALGLTACGAPAATASPSAETPAPSVVTFADPALEAMVRGAMGKPEGGITVAEAGAVTRLNLSMEWQRYISGETPIRDISGLEYFKNLESLDLSFHAIIDITPLAGLKKLALLSLGDNPVADIAPLAGLTNLKVLTLSGCTAQDYGPLAKLVNLEFLMLDHSTITDVSPLASLTGLKRLYLADCRVDYSPLTDIYPNLEESDFTMASTLAELGFTRSGDSVVASYTAEGLIVTINHEEWGIPEMEAENNCVKMYLHLDSGYTLIVMYYPEIDTYVFQMLIHNEMTMNYIYDAARGLTLNSGERESAERIITAALGETDAEDVLLAPIPIFNDTIKTTFGITAGALYALPFEPPTLTNLGFGFVTDEEGNAAYAYHEHEPHDMHISIFRSPWGVSSDGRSIEFYDDDVNGYSLLILYFADAGIYHVALFKDGVDCAFDINPATDEYGQEYPDLDTVHQMFNAAFGTESKELYYEPLTYFERMIQERFGMTPEELYALPLGK